MIRVITLLGVVILSACSVTETGYFFPPEISYTSQDTLTTAEDGEVLVVGENGALSEAGGQLSASNPRSQASATGAVGPAGSFALLIPARRDDVVSLRYTLSGETETLDLTLEDSLEEVATVGCAVCAEALVGPPDQDGNALVRLSSFDDPTPPFVITNSDTGAVVRAETAVDTEIQATAGDTVCIHRLAADMASTASCESVPSS